MISNKIFAISGTSRDGLFNMNKNVLMLCSVNYLCFRASDAFRNIFFY